MLVPTSSSSSATPRPPPPPPPLMRSMHPGTRCQMGRGVPISAAASTNKPINLTAAFLLASLLIPGRHQLARQGPRKRVARPQHPRQRYRPRLHRLRHEPRLPRRPHPCRPGLRRHPRLSMGQARGLCRPLCLSCQSCQSVRLWQIVGRRWRTSIILSACLL